MKETIAEFKLLIDRFNRDVHIENSESETIFHEIMNILETAAEDVSEEGCKTYAAYTTVCNEGIIPLNDVTRKKISSYYQESAWTYKNDGTIDNPKFYIYQNEKIIELADASATKCFDDLYFTFSALLRINTTYQQLRDFSTANTFLMRALKIQLEVSESEYDEWMILDSCVLDDITKNARDLMNLYITQKNLSAAMTTLKEVVLLGINLPDEFYLRYGYPNILFNQTQNTSTI